MQRIAKQNTVVVEAREAQSKKTMQRLFCITQSGVLSGDEVEAENRRVRGGKSLKEVHEIHEKKRKEKHKKA